MTDASARRVEIVAEATPGTTPANPDWMEVAHSACNLKPQIQRIESRLIRTSRDVADNIDVSRSAGGTIDAELQYPTATQGLWRLFLSALQTQADTAATSAVTDCTVSSNVITGTNIGTGIEVGDMVRVRTVTNTLVGYYRVTVVNAGNITVEGTIGDHAAPADYKVVRGRRIKNGATAYYSSIQVSEDTDASGSYDKFEVFTNMNVDTMRLRVADGEVTALSFGFVGADTDGGDTSEFPIGSGSHIGPPTTEVMNSKGHVKALRVAATDYEAKEFEVNIANGMAPRTVIGTLPAISIRSGTFRAQGTIRAYFSDFTEYTKAVNGTASAMLVAWEDSAGNAIGISLPKVKYSDQERPSTGQDTDIFVNLPFSTLNEGGDDGASFRLYAWAN